MIDETTQRCMSACNRCADACDHCSVACLGEPDVAELARCIRMDMDCAAICRLTAGALARGSEWAEDIAPLCAEICAMCAEECEKHRHNHCKECAEACSDCAQICRDMAG